MSDIGGKIDRYEIAPIFNEVYDTDISFLNALEQIVDAKVIKKFESQLLAPGCRGI